MKPIPGFPGYSISEDGVITNPKGKILKRVDTWQGYPRARLKHESGAFKNRKIHRLVALAHLGVNEGEIRHKDNNRANFTVHNLEWTDRLGNAKDRLARGSYHMKTKLVKGKSFLDLGNDKYLDPEAKKVYHVTDNPLGEDGVIPIDSLEKVAYHKRYALIDTATGKIQSGLNTYVNSEEFRKKHIEKKAWTSQRNADKHAIKHADKMGLTKEQYIALAKSALKDKKALINIRGDVHKSRHGKNILVHKDGKVITYFSKTAYVHKIKRHMARAHRRASQHLSDAVNFDYNQDLMQNYIDTKNDKKK